MPRLVIELNGVNLTAGDLTTSEIAGKDIRRLTPADPTLYDQIIHRLSEAPEQDAEETTLWAEAVAAAAVCLRWGSYFAVLADSSKPIWPSVTRPEISRISDSEMARINIEASAALANWIALKWADPARYFQLVHAAAGLPLPTLHPPQEMSFDLVVLADPRAAPLVEQFKASHSAAWDEIRGHPIRTLANGIVNSCWRNGPIEDVHAGLAVDLPLELRRISPEEEAELLQHLAERYLGALEAVEQVRKQSKRPLDEVVAPFRLMPGVGPARWSLTESSREVHLAGPEPPG